MILTSEIVSAWRDKLLSSTPIAEFCTNNFGSALTLQVGSDDRNMLGEKDAPFLNIIPLRSTPGLSQQEVSWDIDIDLGILDDVFEDYGSNGAREMRGIYRLDQFAKLVIAEFESLAGEHNLLADFIEFNMDSSTYFPVHIGALSIQSKLTLPIGATVTLT